jgi:hypothetical protein
VSTPAIGIAIGQLGVVPLSICRVTGKDLELPRGPRFVSGPAQLNVRSSRFIEFLPPVEVHAWAAYPANVDSAHGLTETRFIPTCLVH